MRSARRAFRRGDLGSLAVVRLALAWLNYIDSSHDRPHIVDCLRRIHRIDPAELGKIPTEPVRPKEVADYCRGAGDNGGHRVYWVDRLDKQTSGYLPDRIDPKTSASLMPVLKKAAKDELARRKGPILWLSDLGGIAPKEIGSAAELWADLGRYGGHVDAGERVVVCTAKVGQAYKPTMADAGYVFFWMARSGPEPHGMTRSLMDGKPSCREWVVPKSAVDIDDVWLLPKAAGFSLYEDDVPAAYWDACRAEILARRK